MTNIIQRYFHQSYKPNKQKIIQICKDEMKIFTTTYQNEPIGLHIDREVGIEVGIQNIKNKRHSDSILHLSRMIDTKI